MSLCHRTFADEIAGLIEVMHSTADAIVVRECLRRAAEVRLAPTGGSLGFGSSRLLVSVVTSVAPPSLNQPPPVHETELLPLLGSSLSAAVTLALNEAAVPRPKATLIVRSPGDAELVVQT